MTETGFRDALVMIQMEYVEMPELKLTVRQAGKLWNLAAETSEAAMVALVASGFLIQMKDQSFVRRGTPPVQVLALDPLTWAVGGFLACHQGTNEEERGPRDRRGYWQAGQYGRP
jgi:hypothetical protein